MVLVIAAANVTAYATGYVMPPYSDVNTGIVSDVGIGSGLDIASGVGTVIGIGVGIVPGTAGDGFTGWC